MSGNTGFIDGVTENASKAKTWGVSGLNAQLAKASLPAIGGNQYLQYNAGRLSDSFNALRSSGLGGMDQVRIGGLAALDYFTGMDTGRVMGRGASRMATAAGGSEAAQARHMGMFDDMGRTARTSALIDPPAGSTGARMRGARAGVRMGALGAGMAALDFLNPFSFGWND